ncbi:MAG: MgtC/SapB family protein [Bacillota bacterium]|nr:MgtC/SapB family protein [Bacillota bacterium]
MISVAETVLRLLLSAAIGGAIGMEREVHNRPAGLRTHVLVSLGSALIMLISSEAFIGRGDPARLAAQVVSGIGFLGAGTIMRNGNSINGLTTAASLWVSAGIGLAIGAGYYIGGAVTGLIVIITLVTLGRLEKKLLPKSYRIIEAVVEDKPEMIGKIGTVLGLHKILIKDIMIRGIDGSSVREGEGSLINVVLTVKAPSNAAIEMFSGNIRKVDGIVSVIVKE